MQTRIAKWGQLIQCVRSESWIEVIDEECEKHEVNVVEDPATKIYRLAVRKLQPSAHHLGSMRWR